MPLKTKLKSIGAAATLEGVEHEKHLRAWATESPLVSSYLISFCCPGLREAAGGSSPPEGGRRAVGHPGPPSTFRGSLALALPCASSAPAEPAVCLCPSHRGGPQQDRADTGHAPTAPTAPEHVWALLTAAQLSSRSPRNPLQGVGPLSIWADRGTEARRGRDLPGNSRAELSVPGSPSV